MNITTNLPVYDWIRYWSNGSSINRFPSMVPDLDSMASEERRSLGIFTFDELPKTTISFLLGDAALGKSYFFRQFRQLHPERTFLDLEKIYDPSDLWSQLTASINDYSNNYCVGTKGNGTFYLLLDSLDEVPSRNAPKQQIFAFINKLLDISKRIRELSGGHLKQVEISILSRTVELDMTLYNHVKEKFGEAEVATFYMLPLHEGQIRQLITQEANLSQVGNVEIVLKFIFTNFLQGIAEKPKRLRALVQFLNKNGCVEVPDLWTIMEQQVEASLDYRREGLEGATRDSRLAVAGRLATLAVLAKKPRIDLDGHGSQTEAEFRLSIADVEDPDLESADKIAGSRAILRELLGTDVFTKIAGMGEVRWSQKSDMEFLAAWYIARRAGECGSEIEPFVSRLIQTTNDPLRTYAQREVACWLAIKDKRFKETLLFQTPDLFLQSEVAVPGGKLNALIVERLLLAVSEGRVAMRTVDSLLRNATQLTTEGQASDLIRSWLLDQNKQWTGRYISASLVQCCSLTSCVEALAGLVMNVQENYELRVRCAIALRFVQTPGVLASLAEWLPRDMEGDDDDELKGVLLDLLWPEFLSTSGVLSRIIPPKKESLFGLYRNFLSIFTDSLDKTNVLDGLGYLIEFEDPGCETPGFGPLSDLRIRIGKLALSALDDIAVRENFSVYLGRFGSKLYDLRPPQSLSDEMRLDVWYRTLKGLGGRFNPGLIWGLGWCKTSDLPEVLSWLDSENSELRAGIIETISQLYDPDDPTLVEKTKIAMEKHGDFRQKMLPYFSSEFFERRSIDLAERKKALEKLAEGEREREIQRDKIHELLKEKCLEATTWETVPATFLHWVRKVILQSGPDFKSRPQEERTLQVAINLTTETLRNQLQTIAQKFKLQVPQGPFDHNNAYITLLAFDFALTVTKSQVSDLTLEVIKGTAPIVLILWNMCLDDSCQKVRKDFTLLLEHDVPALRAAFRVLVLDPNNQHPWDLLFAWKELWKDDRLLQDALFDRMKDGSLTDENAALLAEKLMEIGHSPTINYMDSQISEFWATSWESMPWFSDIGRGTTFVDEGETDELTAKELTKQLDKIVAPFSLTALWEAIKFYPDEQVRAIFQRLLKNPSHLLVALHPPHFKNSRSGEEVRTALLKKLDINGLISLYQWLLNSFNQEIQRAENNGDARWISGWEPDYWVNDIRQKLVSLASSVDPLSESALAGLETIGKQFHAEKQGWNEMLIKLRRGRALSHRALEPAEIKKLLLDRDVRFAETAKDLATHITELLGEFELAIRQQGLVSSRFWNENSHEGTSNIPFSPKDEHVISNEILAFLASKSERGVFLSREVQFQPYRKDASVPLRKGEVPDIVIHAKPIFKDKTLRVVIEVKGCWNQDLFKDGDGNQVCSMDWQLTKRYLDPSNHQDVDDVYGIYLVGWFWFPEVWKSGTRFNFTRTILNHIGISTTHPTDQALFEAKQHFGSLALTISESKPVFSKVLDLRLPPEIPSISSL